MSVGDFGGCIFHFIIFLVPFTLFFEIKSWIITHFVQIVQSSLGATLPPSLWLSEKSILWLGRGTMPGSVKTALAWAMNNMKMIMLNITTWKLAHRLPAIVCITIHLKHCFVKMISNCDLFWYLIQIPDNNIICIQYCSISHGNAEKSTRVLLKHRHLGVGFEDYFLEQNVFSPAKSISNTCCQLIFSFLFISEIIK